MSYTWCKNWCYLIGAQVGDPGKILASNVTQYVGLLRGLIVLTFSSNNSSLQNAMKRIRVSRLQRLRPWEKGLFSLPLPSVQCPWQLKEYQHEGCISNNWQNSYAMAVKLLFWTATTPAPSIVFMFAPCFQHEPSSHSLSSTPFRRHEGLTQQSFFGDT